LSRIRYTDTSAAKAAWLSRCRCRT